MKLLDFFVYIVKMDIPTPIRLFTDRFGKSNISTYSASTSYFFLQSLVPLCIMLMAILPFTSLSKEELVHLLTSITPNFVDKVIEIFIDAAYTQSISLLSGSLLVAIWSASRGMLGLSEALNTICDVEEKRNFIVLRVFAVLYTVAVMGVICLMLMFLVFGNQILAFLISILPEWKDYLEELMDYRLGFVMLPSAVLITLIYTFVPMERKTIKSQIPGALLCTVSWVLFSMAFSIYVDVFGASSLYGSLATPMMVMLWLYFCVYILFIGALINEVIETWKKMD